MFTTERGFTDSGARRNVVRLPGCKPMYWQAREIAEPEYLMFLPVTDVLGALCRGLP